MTARLIKNKKGFSLLEAAMAIMIMSFGFFVTTHFMQSYMLNSFIADQKIVGTQLARGEMEKVLIDKEYQGYDYIVNGNYPFQNFTNEYEGYKQFIYILEVSTKDLVTPQPGSGIKRVVSYCYWGPNTVQRAWVTGIVTRYN